MSVTHAGTSLGLTLHGTPQPGQWQSPLVRQTWFGVRGEATLIGAQHGRQIKLMAHLSGYATLNAVLTKINALQALRGSFGSLVIDLGGGDITTYTLTLLETVKSTETPWLDGSGVNGWQCDIELIWRQSNA